MHRAAAAALPEKSRNAELAGEVGCLAVMAGEAGQVRGGVVQAGEGLLIADDIAAKIAAGTYAAGQRLPSEAELAGEYGTARMTVQRAVRELRERGLVETVYGEGTYVLAPERGPGPE